MRAMGPSEALASEPGSPISGSGRRISLGFRPSGFGFPSGRRAFTLLEMLLALAVSAIVLAGIGGVFFSAIRLRERTTALLDESLPVYRTLGFLRRDLRGALPPGGVMTGDFRLGSLNSGIGQSLGIQFTTTTGVIGDDGPWGEVQEVTYELRDPVVRTGGAGRDLIRSTSRNLLSTGLLDYNEQWLMGNIQSLEYACFDGVNWLDLWDTSLTETNLPLAVRVRIQTVADENVDARNRQPIEMIVPIITQTRTNLTQQTSGGDQ
ncbi:MAG TPA: type II secretion system protein GspJ [Verrucomicrobiae bacterium]